MAKGKSIFRFKQFEISHAKSSMKVGTDAVLIGAWTRIKEDRHILEVGTGCGIITLMLAQRNNTAQIDAIDIHKESVEEASFNFKNSPWNNRITAHLTSFQDFNPEYQYNHIVSNPPFFTHGSVSPKEQRHSARHMDKLSYSELMKHADLLLLPEGKLSIIIPYSQVENCIALASENNLKVSRILDFYPKKSRAAERSIITLLKTNEEITFQKDNLVHYNELNDWTDDYKSLTHEYHLNL